MGNVYKKGQEFGTESSKNRPLTYEEKLLVAENHDLIYYFLNRAKLDIEDNYDIAALGLIEAVKCFDKNRGTRFDRFAYACMKNKVLSHQRHDVERRIKYGVSFVPLDTHYSDNEHEITEDTNILSTLIDMKSSNIEEETATRLVFGSNLCYLVPRELEALIFTIKGLNLDQAGRQCGVSHTVIQKRLVYARQIIQSEGYRDEIVRKRLHRIIKELTDARQFSLYIEWLETIRLLTGVSSSFAGSEFCNLILQGKLAITYGFGKNIEMYLRMIVGNRVGEVMQRVIVGNITSNTFKDTKCKKKKSSGEEYYGFSAKQSKS